MADSLSSPIDMPSPLHSRTSSTSSRGPKTPLSIDLSAIPPLVQPSPPSNTLIITNLHDPSIFHATNITAIRDLINTHALIHTFSPLKSFRRIIVSFYSLDAAIAIRSQLDGTHLMGVPVRVFYGTDTPLNQADQHLELPKSAKLFFISPPPSPPHGWEQINEDPPNKMVHADDLAAALAQLRSRDVPADPLSPTSDNEAEKMDSPGQQLRTRSRGLSTTIVYHPDDHGDSPHLPAIEVEDTTFDCATPEEMDVDTSTSPGSSIQHEKAKMWHTPRPPVELM